MNDDRLPGFRTLVAKVIDPIVASARRKQGMREELLAHLVASYDQELQRCADEMSAANAVIARFGDADELRAQLQSTVPIIERILSIFNPKEQTMSRWPLAVGIIGTIVGFAFLLGLGIVMPATAKLIGHDLAQIPPGQIEAAQLLKISLLGLLVLSAMVMFSGLGTLVYAFIVRKRQAA